MNPDEVFGVWHVLKKMSPEVLGGFGAYWTHNICHKLYHKTENFPRFVNAVREFLGGGVS